MISFDLSEEQKALRQTAREFVQKEIIPVAAKYDESGEFPWPIFQKGFELGLLNLGLPKELGGLELSNVDMLVVNEELAAGCTGVLTSMMVNDLAMKPVVLAGSEKQKKKWLLPFMEQLQFGSFALTEPGAGSDVAGMSTSVKRVGNDYLLNGEKVFITNASHSKMFVVFATHDRSKRDKGISAFVVPSGVPGLTIGKKEHKMGQRASNTASVIFKDVKISAEDRLGNEGEGFKIAMRTLDYSRPLVAIAGVGLARQAMEYAIKYAQERKQFDQTIASFQAVQFMIADMAKEIEACRWLTYYSAWLLDHNKPSTVYSSMAKCLATDVAMRVTTDAVQIFGGYGYSREFPVEKLMRDAKLLQIYEGTNQIQRLVIAKNLLNIS